MDFTPDQLEKLRALKEDPVAWSRAFVKIRTHDGDMVPFEANYAQRKVMASNSRRTAINIHRRGGKCSITSDPIYLADGTKTTHGEMVNKQFEVLTLVGDTIKPVTAFATYNDFEEVYEIETESGRIITRNAEHPLFMAEHEQVSKGKPKISPVGWTSTENLVPGQLLALPRRLDFILPEEDIISDSEVKILAYLIGDGCLRLSHGIGFSQENNAQLQEMRLCCQDIGVELKYHSGYDYRLIRASGEKQNNALALARLHGIYGKNSFEKFIPSVIFRSPLRQIALFLSRLYSTDGWACLKKDSAGARGSGQIGYCSVSKRLILEVQHLLLRFGVNSRIEFKPKTKSYSLNIDNFEDAISFCEQIGIYGKEKALAEVYNQSLLLRDKKYGKAENLVWENGHLYKRYKDINKSSRKRPYEFTRNIDVTPWRIKGAPPGMRWERITRVTKLAEKQHTIAVSVPEHHTYLTDFYEHNTFGLAMIAIWALVTKAKCQILFIAPGEAQIEKFFETFDDILANNPLLKESLAKSGNTNKPFRRKFVNGSYLWGFIAANGSKSLRGQSADIIILDEADYIEDENWKAIDPIVRGDKYRKPPRMYAASTPNMDPKSRFLSWFDDELRDKEDSDVTPIFIPITENPEYTDEEREDIRKEYVRLNKMHEWDQEYLCLPGVSNAKFVFKKHQIDDAARGEYEYPPFADQLPPKNEKAIRAVGVDWDVVQAGPSIICVEWIKDSDHVKVIWREEISNKIEFLQHHTCEYLVKLHKILRYDYLMLEGTADVFQAEHVMLMAKEKDPELLPKIHRIDYNTNHISYDSVNREKIPRRIKNVIVGNLQTWFQDKRIIFPKDDRELNTQLSMYEVLRRSERGDSYSKEREHFVDALGLACWAIFKFHNNPFASMPAVRISTIPFTENSSVTEKSQRKPLLPPSYHESMYDTPQKGPTRRSWGSTRTFRSRL